MRLMAMFPASAIKSMRGTCWSYQSNRNIEREPVGGKMSGSGSGSGNGGRDWVPQNNDACETLNQQLALNSPNPKILKLLKTNDILEIRSQKVNGAVIVEAIYQGDVAGTITSTIFQRIADCIEKGFEYVAQVVDVQGGACRVNVRPK